MNIGMNKCIAPNRRRFEVSKGVRFVHKYFAVKVYFLIKYFGVFLLECDFEFCEF